MRQSSLTRHAVTLALCLFLSFSSALSAAPGAKKYQVTGKITELTDTKIVVQTVKGDERWEIERSADMKVEGELKVGAKVTIEYRMVAVNAEVKPEKIVAATRKLPQIVVMGGGGFSMEPRNPRLDRYVLSLTGKARPRVCFVGTASGDSQRYIDRFYRAFAKHRCIARHLPLFHRDGPSPAKRIFEHDLIYVGGGNTANLLAVWRVHDIDRAMREAWKRGIVLCGISAGMICWFECSVTDSFGPLRNLNDGLSLLPGSACPHYDGEAQRRPTYHRLIRAGFPAGYAADDGAAIHFIGRRVHRCVASRPGARVYRVVRAERRVNETSLPTSFLNRDGTVPR